MKNKYKLLKVLLVVLAFVIAGIAFSCKGTSDNELTSVSYETYGGEQMSEAEAETETRPQICVHVCGAVNTPGVYYLEPGSRVHNAVEMAGGLTADASDSFINMAQEVPDGVRIYIPTKSEVTEGTIPEGSEAGQKDDGLVNINTAPKEALSQLPGIGESKADAIITYRENVGAFETPEDIMNVAGIKDSSFEKIKDKIKVK